LPAPSCDAAQIERTQLPRLRIAKRTEVGLGWLIARPPARGCRPPALAQRRDQPLSQLRRRQPGDRHRRGRAQQHRPVVDRLGLRLVKALSTHAS
jgi:hypothetical protein